MEFMSRRISYLMKEQEDGPKPLNTRGLGIEVIKALEEPQKTKIPNPYDEGVLPLDLKKEPKQCEVTMSREDKNQNGKRMTVGVRSHSWIAAGAEPNAHQFKCHDLLIKGDEWK
jgi:hypothetical protein